MIDTDRAPTCRATAVAALVLSALTSTLPGCGLARRHVIGGQCELTNECDTPLVCRLAHCRNECANSGAKPTPLEYP